MSAFPISILLMLLFSLILVLMGIDPTLFMVGWFTGFGIVAGALAWVSNR